jgi:hypothetical protein
VIAGVTVPWMAMAMAGMTVVVGVAVRRVVLGRVTALSLAMGASESR